MQRIICKLYRLVNIVLRLLQVLEVKVRDTRNIKQDYSLKCSYCNAPKFSDRQVWANNVDPDQIGPEGAI